MIKARELPVKIIKNLFTASEVEKINKIIPTLSGREVQNMFDHPVTWVHRNNLFQDQFPTIFKKMLNAVNIADKET
eukprot:UN10628